MKQVNNGYADYYYLREDGVLYNAQKDCIVPLQDDHIYIIKTTDNQRKKISLKNLYTLVYNKPYCKDTIQNIEGEVWKEIDHTNGLYYISNKGRVKSYQGYTATLLCGYANQGNYLRVDLKQEGKRQSKLIHRLVAAAFLPFPDNIEMQLHHKDFNKSNNAADNLEWLTAAKHKDKHIEQRRQKNACAEPEIDSCK